VLKGRDRISRTFKQIANIPIAKLREDPVKFAPSTFSGTHYVTLRALTPEIDFHF
jgi:hypothetical protein